jgi:hypothetical protein
MRRSPIDDTNDERRDLMRAHRDEEGATLEPAVAGGLSKGILSRRQMLALVGGAIAGAAVSFIPRFNEAEAQGTGVSDTESGTVLSDYDKTALADNPVAYYRLDGNNVKDLSPRNHDGRYAGYIGGPTTTKLPSGEAATVFDGSS